MRWLGTSLCLQISMNIITFKLMRLDGREMMKSRNHLSYVLISIGFILGFSLFLLDKWLDSHNYPIVLPWSIVIVAYMGFGGVIGRLLNKIFEEQRKREEVISAEQKRLSDLFNSLPGIVVVVRENYQVRFANHSYSMLFGGEREGNLCYEMVGKKSPCENCKIEEVIGKDLALKGEELLLNNRIYEATMQPLKDHDGSRLVIKTLYDITERKRAERELSRLHVEMSHLERMNLVGQMAAGIAHEIRNPMTIVRGYLQLLGTRPEFFSQKSTFDLMIKELDRANIIISDFLSITKESPAKLNYQNIDEIMQHLYPLLEADAYSQKKQILYQAGETPNILMNPDEISQLVLNLCRNGLEAMEAGGTITIRTYLENEKVVLSIEDEGEGIKTEYMERIGTPFFTTKENGTGLGLSTCYNIADRNNAAIDFKCSPSGTTFFVRFLSAGNEIGSFASRE